MKRNRFHNFYCPIVFLLLLSFASSGYGEKGEDPYKRAAKLYADGNHGEALGPAKEALAEAEKEYGADGMELSRQLNLLSDIYQKRGEWQEASLQLERLRAIEEAALGLRSMKVAKTVSKLISVYEKQGDPQRAEQLNQSASERWGRQENPDLKKLTPARRRDSDPDQKGPLMGKWGKLSETPNYIKIASLMADYHKKHQYLMEDFFVCSDMAIEVWDIIKTAGVNARLMVGNVNRDIVKYKSTYEYIAEMNHVWVMAEIMPSEWVPVEATAGIIVHPQTPTFEFYHNGTYFDSPRYFKEFSESRKALFQTCREANIMVTDFNSNYAGKSATREGIERTGRTKQKVDDCNNLKDQVVSYLRN